MKHTVHEMFDMRKAGLSWVEIQSITGVHAKKVRQAVENIVFNELYPVKKIGLCFYRKRYKIKVHQIMPKETNYNGR